MTAPRIGDRIRMTQETFEAGVDMPGTVTYIHPSGRWYQVSFDVGIKECFFVEPEPILRDGNHYRKHKGGDTQWAGVKIPGP